MRIKGVIFDLDGVITDTAELHYRAWKRLAEELGIPCPPERKDQVRGVSRRRSLAIVLTGNPQANENDVQDLLTEEEAERLMARKNGYYQELIQEIGAKDLLPGVRELISDLRRQGVKVAVATVSQNAGDVLERLGILAEFDAVVDGHSGARTKPAPNLFLQAAARLGVAPGECVVVEDAPAGIEAAEAAGMVGVALGPQERFAQVQPHLIIPSLAGLSYERLEALLAQEEEKTRSWRVEERGFAPTAQGRFETNFTVGNGYLGTRGTLEEGYPGEVRATLIHRLFDASPIFSSELVNAPDWTNVQLYVDEVPFSPQYGETHFHNRWLDLRDGILHRHVRWRSPKGQMVEVRTTRFASMADPHLCVQTYAITAIDRGGTMEIRTCLPTSPENPGVPPFPEIGLCHWERVSHGFPDQQTLLLRLKTRRSQTELATAMGLLWTGVPNATILPLDGPYHPGMAIRFRLEPGETAVVIKFVTLYTSWDTTDPGQVALSRLNEAKREGLAAILRDHRAQWRKLWEVSDIVIEGDEIAQIAVRFNLYHLLIAAPRTVDASIPAKALTGFGYRGHIFWDTEIFMLPFFSFTQPEVARRILAYRYHTLPGARENARSKGFRGAMYAWESAHDGRETTPRWVPKEDGSWGSIRTGELEHHISADVAYTVWQYWKTTGDDEFMRAFGAEIILSTAQFWASRVEKEGEQYVIRHVIGPDEYHEDVDNNAFTNALVRWNLRAATMVWKWMANFPEQATMLKEKLNLTEGEVQDWQKIAEHMYIPSDSHHGLIEQFQGYFSLEDLDLRGLEPRDCSVRDLLGPERTQRLQIIKQPDVLMLFHLLPEEFPTEALRANWAYYEPRTDHRFGSSLGPAIHAILACRVGDVACAYEHFMRAALVDLQDLRGNTSDGIHAASCGGVWQALVFGFGGLRLGATGPVAWPNLPRHWRCLRFSIRYQGKLFSFRLTPEMQGPVSAIPVSEQK